MPRTRAASRAASQPSRAHGLAQRGHGLGVALTGQRDPQLEQDGGPVRGIRWLVQRAAQVVRGRVRGAAASGGARGRPQQPGGPRVAARLAAQQVQRDAFDVGTLVFGQHRRFGMGQSALAGRDRLVDRRPDDGVGELEHRAGRQHAGRAQPVGQVRRGGQVQAGQRRGVPERRGPAQHGQRPGQPPGLLVPDPPQHRLGDRTQAPGRAVAVPQPGGQRLDQERVAAGAGVAVPAQVRVGARAQERGGRLRAQRPQPQPGPGHAQFIQQGRLVRPVAHGQQQRDRQAVDAGGQVREPAQRRPVGPVRVVHGDHQRAFGRQVRGQPVEAVHGRVRDVVLDRAGLGPVEHPRGQAGRAVQQPLPSGLPAAARTGSSSWRTIPYEKPCSSASPRAVRVRWSPWQAARSSVVLPIPAGPSTSTRAPCPAEAAATAADSAASSSSRSSITG